MTQEPALPRRHVGGAVSILILACAFLSRPALAGDVITLDPRSPYGVDGWKPGSAPGLDIRFVVRHPVTMTLNHLVQVAPGGATIAACDPAKRLVLLAARGAELWHRDGPVPAFRFSPTGAELALASRQGIEILSLAGLKTRNLAPLAGINWLRWIDGGLLARARNKLYLVDFAGTKKLLTAFPSTPIIAASPRRLIYFRSGTITDVDLATGRTLSVTKLVDQARVVDAELSPDGKRVLFATAKHVYLIEGQSPPKKLANVHNLRSLYFSPDGSSYLWASWSGGALVADGKSTPLPADTFDAHFRHDGGAEIVITLVGRRSVCLWNPLTGKQTDLGGLRPLSADFVGDYVVTLYVTQSILDKERSLPGQDLKAGDAIVL